MQGTREKDPVLNAPHWTGSVGIEVGGPMNDAARCCAASATWRPDMLTSEA